MANFKGGFAFNNEAAKVEVEQAPDGTLISCVNPVTGEDLNARNYVETFTGTANALTPLSAIPELSDPDDFAALLASGDVDIEISFDMSALGGTILIGTVATTKLSDGTILTPKVQNIVINGTNTADGSLVSHINFSRISGLIVMDSYLYQSGSWVDMTTHLSAIPTVTKIYHHPMS